MEPPAAATSCLTSLPLAGPLELGAVHDLHFGRAQPLDRLDEGLALDPSGMGEHHADLLDRVRGVVEDRLRRVLVEVLRPANDDDPAGAEQRWTGQVQEVAGVKLGTHEVAQVRLGVSRTDRRRGRGDSASDQQLLVTQDQVTVGSSGRHVPSMPCPGPLSPAGSGSVWTSRSLGSPTSLRDSTDAPPRTRSLTSSA